MKKLFITMICILGILTTLGCAHAVRTDGPYRGRIIDVDSREPIEGVVVLGTWDRETPTVAGAVHRYYDARETATDKDGEFEIKGLGLLVMSNITPMNVLIFKAGYTHFGLMTWNELSKTVKVENGRAIIRLRKLTMEQRRRLGSPDYPSEAPEEKIRMMLREINKDRMEKGLKPVN